MEGKPTAKERRDRLRELSKGVEPLVKMGAYDTINEAIIDTVYTDAENFTFNTFRKWLELGFQVKKGSTAFVVWGRPKKNQEAEQKSAAAEDEDEKRKFWPMAYLFSNAQVERVKEKEVA